MLQSIRSELHSRKHEIKEQVKTIYFGGGSPSILSTQELGSFLSDIQKFFSLSENLEVTLEANPDDLDLEKLKGLRSIGINRLSIGIQSFRDEDLKLMNRAHNSRMAIESIERSRSVGFSNLNLDLIYGIPGLSLQQWKENLDLFRQFDAEHLSAYNLTIEERTAFAHWVKKDRLKVPEDEVVLEQFKDLMNWASECDYEHYEISNFAREGFESQHNTSYWKGEKYLGIGPSAHSFDGQNRRWNMRNNPLYIKAMLEGESYWEEEELTDLDHFNEYILTRLRTKWGLKQEEVVPRFGQEAWTSLLNLSLEHQKAGHLSLEKSGLYLTEKGKFVADRVTSDLFRI